MMKSDIIDIVNGYVGVKNVAYHSFINIPAAHCFATWFVPSVSFDGADLMASEKNIVLEIHFFYKKYYSDADIQQEEDFEEAVKKCGRFQKSCGYDNNNELFFTTYTFSLHEFY